MPSQQAPSAAFTPRNLVVLSDGTGNSAAKLAKTNVWRLYDALDLAAGDQLALYDDGVGTASFKPLALLGGMFGFGLKRNVLDLYTFLCRNYRHDPANPEIGDRIFAFGFSRGAYTARVVAAMVAVVGLVQVDSEGERQRQARWAYREYRRARFSDSLNPLSTLGLRAFRWMRDVAIRTYDRVLRRSSFASVPRVQPDIHFLGVWDTVSAYGLPIEELTRGWERWIWPMLPKDRTVSHKIRRARHALAIDDERQTFFPLLWTEAGESANATSTHVDQERLTQVWFAGVHSNVGGGYSDDGLSHTPLQWMAQEACRYGLRLATPLTGPALPPAWTTRAAPYAPLNDSRHGLGAYYRYHPRPIERLCNDPDADVHVPRPKIHESVFARMADGVDGYAPLVLPADYAIVTSDGRILSGAAGQTANPCEHPSQSAARRVRQEHALNIVWWRRVVYFATVGVTVLVLLTPLCPVNERLDWLGWEAPTLAALVGMLDSLLPGFMAPWLEYYQQRPVQLLVGGAVIWLLLAISSALRVASSDRMRAAWRDTGLVAQPVSAVPPPDDLLYRMRTSRAYRAGFRTLSVHVWPNVFGLALLVGLVVVLPIRVAYEVASRADVLPASDCAEARALQPLGDTPVSFALWPQMMCTASGVTVEKGVTYRVDLALPDSCEGAGDDTWTGGWHDDAIPVGTAWGFSSLEGFPHQNRLLFTLAAPLRRDLAARWFQPVVEIGRRSPSRLVLTRPLAGDEAMAAETAAVGRAGESITWGTFVAPRDGALSMFVNDALLPFGGLDAAYRNNRGGPARVRIARLSATPGESGASGLLAPFTCAEQRALVFTR